MVDAIRARARRPAPGADDWIEHSALRVTEEGAADDRLMPYQGLATLSRGHREVIVAVHLDGMSYEQPSHRTGVPVTTLRTRMFYGLKDLRESLRGRTGDDGQPVAT